MGFRDLGRRFQTSGAPTVSDDNTEGFAIGDLWTDTATGDIYQATDVSTGAAVWEQFSTRKPAEDYPYPPKHMTGLGVSYISATTVEVAPGNCIDSTDAVNMVLASATQADITASGAGGLDTSDTENADTWYAVHLISGTSGTSVMLSDSDTAPTLPGGYSNFRFLQWVRNDSSSDFMLFYEFESGLRRRAVQYLTVNTDRVVLAAGTATVSTAVDLSTFVPPSSLSAVLEIENDSGSRIMRLHDDLGTVITDIIVSNGVIVSSVPTTSSQEIFYSNDGGGGDANIVVQGFNIIS